MFGAHCVISLLHIYRQLMRKSQTNVNHTNFWKTFLDVIIMFAGLMVFVICAELPGIIMILEKDGILKKNHWVNNLVLWLKVEAFAFFTMITSSIVFMVLSQFGGTKDMRDKEEEE